MGQAQAFVRDLKKLATRSTEDLAIMQRFFKTGKGEYGEGDVFIGLTVPQIRLVCKQYNSMELDDLEKLLEDPVHEVRFGATIIMASQAARRATAESRKKALYDLYLRRTDRINNWDIVDASCRDVVGGYLFNRSRAPLYKLARSQNLWERRIAIVSTWYFIREGDLADTFAIAQLLLGDTQDLIHKASGWMLREAGKKDRNKLITFLDKHAKIMPRTMLRYAIEHLTAEQKAHYLGVRKLKKP
ncbi:MAG TPA: DNA alkylation repair protein [Candidatus Saccharimonadales bacterium]|nr:DNA alkylation repair protein [Candidatus Saccharimonadales bacterium]